MKTWRPPRTDEQRMRSEFDGTLPTKDCPPADRMDRPFQRMNVYAAQLQVWHDVTNQQPKGNHDQDTEVNQSNPTISNNNEGCFRPAATIFLIGSAALGIIAAARLPFMTSEGKLTRPGEKVSRRGKERI